MSHDARVGTLVSEHRIIRLLAEGDSWCTYLAERFSHRSVLRITNIGADPAMASRLAAMHDVASRLVSPGLVAVEEVGTTKDGATFVRQSFAGESLASRLARGDAFDNVVNLGTRLEGGPRRSFGDFSRRSRSRSTSPDARPAPSVPPRAWPR